MAPVKPLKKDPNAWCTYCKKGKHSVETCRTRIREEQKEALRRDKGERSPKPSAPVGQVPGYPSAGGQPSDQAGPLSATFPIDSTVPPRSSNQPAEAVTISDTARSQSAGFDLPADSPAPHENSESSQVGEQETREPKTNASGQRPRKSKGARNKKKARELEAQAAEPDSTGTILSSPSDPAAGSRAPDREMTSIGRSSSPSSFDNGDKPSGPVAGPAFGEKATTPVQQKRPYIFFESSMQDDSPRKKFGPKAKAAWDKKKSESPEPEGPKLDLKPKFRHREYSKGANPLFDRKEPVAATDSSQAGVEVDTDRSDVPGAFPESPPSSTEKPKATSIGIESPAAAASTPTAKQSGDTNAKPAGATALPDSEPVQAVSGSADSLSPEQSIVPPPPKKLWRVVDEDEDEDDEATAHDSKQSLAEEDLGFDLYAVLNTPLKMRGSSRNARLTSAKKPASASDKTSATAGPRSGPGLTTNPPRSSKATNSTTAAQGPATNSNIKPLNSAQATESTNAGRGLSQIPPQQTEKRLAKSPKAPIAPSSEEELDYGDRSDSESDEQTVSGNLAQQPEAPFASTSDDEVDYRNNSDYSDSESDKSPLSPDLAQQPEAPVAPTPFEKIDHEDYAHLESDKRPISPDLAEQLPRKDRIIANAVSRRNRGSLPQEQAPRATMLTQFPTSTMFGIGPQPSTSDNPPKPAQVTKPTASGQGSGPSSSDNRSEPRQATLATVSGLGSGSTAPDRSPEPEKATIPKESGQGPEPAQATVPAASRQASEPSGSDSKPSPKPAQATVPAASRQKSEPSASHNSPSPKAGTKPAKATGPAASRQRSKSSAFDSSHSPKPAPKPARKPAQATKQNASGQESGSSASDSSPPLKPAQAAKPTASGPELGSSTSNNSPSARPAQAPKPTASGQESGSSPSDSSSPPEPAQAMEPTSRQKSGSSGSKCSPSPEAPGQEPGPSPPIESPESVHATNAMSASQPFSSVGDGEQNETQKAPMQNEDRPEESGSGPKASPSKIDESEDHSHSQERHRRGYDEDDYDEGDYGGSDYDGSDDWSSDDDLVWNLDPIDLLPSQRGILKLLLWVSLAAFMFLVGSVVGKHVSAIKSKHPSTCFIAPELVQRSFVTFQHTALAGRAAVLSFIGVTIPRPDFVNENGQYCFPESLTYTRLAWGLLLAVSEAGVLIIVSLYRDYHHLRSSYVLRHYLTPATFAVVLPLELGVCNGFHDWLFSSTSRYLYGILYITLCSLAHKFSSLESKQQLLSFAGVLFVLAVLLGRTRASNNSDALGSLRRLRDIGPRLQAKLRAFHNTLHGLNAGFMPAWRVRWLAESNNLRREIFLVVLGILLLLAVIASIPGPRFVESIRSMPSISTKLSMPTKLSSSYWRTKFVDYQTTSVALPPSPGPQTPTAHQTLVRTITATTTATEWHYPKTKKVIPPHPPTLSKLLERIANQSFELSKTALPLNPAPAALHGALREIRDAFPHYFYSEEITKFTSTSDRRAEARSWLKLLIRLDGASHQLVDSFTGASVGFTHWVAVSALMPLWNIEKYEATGSTRSFWRKGSHASCNLHTGLCGYPRDFLRRSELAAFVTDLLDRVQYITDNGELTIQAVDRIGVLVEKIIRVNWDVNTTYNISTQSKHAYGGLKALAGQSTWALKACSGKDRKIRYCLEAVFRLAQDMKQEARAVLAEKDKMVLNLRAAVELLGNDSYGVDLARDWDTAGYTNHLVKLLVEAESARWKES